MPIRQLTAVIERDDDWYVALCPELDIASQGKSMEEARRNLIEAIELPLEAASPSEIQERTHWLSRAETPCPPTPSST